MAKRETRQTLTSAQVAVQAFQKQGLLVDPRMVLEIIAETLTLMQERDEAIGLLRRLFEPFVTNEVLMGPWERKDGRPPTFICPWCGGMFSPISLSDCDPAHKADCPWVAGDRLLERYPSVARAG